MKVKYWYEAYGKHGKFASEELYVGDVLAENSSQAKATAKGKFPKWDITKVRRGRRASPNETLRY